LVQKDIKQETKKDKYSKGIKLYNDGNYSQSANFFEKLTKKTPQDDKAYGWLKKVILEQSTKAQGLYQKGMVEFSKGNVDQAIETWKNALKIAPFHESTQRVLKKAQRKKKSRQ